MNGYSKMRLTNTNSTPKSRSMDLGDLTEDPSGISKGKEEQEENEESGERFGVILSRNCSTASQRFRRSDQEKVSNGGSSTTAATTPTKLQEVVRRAFSMRKSSSVGDGYWRIHDTGVGEEEEEEVVVQEEGVKGEAKRKKKRGGIFRAWKKLLKF